jgi:regulator of protease activity HflC (stomatin/prohibitin superfamily)
MFFIYIVPQASAFVVERLGVYKTTWGAGLHFCIPLLDRVSRKMSLKEQVADFPPQNVITKDNCLVQVDTVVFFQVSNPKLFTYGVMDPISAISNLSATTLRSLIGNLTLEEAMTSRESINNHMSAALDEATDPWGIKINRVEIKDIIPPNDVRESMEKQIKAERDKRAAILNAEANKQAAILVAEGNKEAMILNAEGKKKTAILDAEAEKEARILRAEAEKQQRILKSEGEAQAILKVQEAKAKGIRMISDSNPTDKYIDLQKLDTLAKVGNGRATKIIIPSELQEITGLAISMKEATTSVKSDIDLEKEDEEEINEDEF